MSRKGSGCRPSGCSPWASRRSSSKLSRWVMPSGTSLVYSLAHGSERQTLPIVVSHANHRVRAFRSLLAGRAPTCRAQIPTRDVMPPFEYVRKLKREQVEELLKAADLGGLTQLLMDGIEQLSAQPAASSAQLNDKFQASGKFQMSYGSLSLFYGGLESLLGPPQVRRGCPPGHAPI